MSDNILTNSSMSTYKACPRRYFFQQELGLRSARESKPLRLGSVFHEGLDELARGATPQAVFESACAKYERELPEGADKTEWEVERFTVATLLLGYAWRWSESQVEVLDSELVFSGRIINPETGAATPVFNVSGKIDKIVRLADGRLAVMEHKTSSEDISPQSDYWLRLRMDQQVSLEMLGAKMSGWDVVTCVYDVVRKPAINPRKLSKADVAVLRDSGKYYGIDVVVPADLERETPQMFGARLLDDCTQRPDFYFARNEVPRASHDLREFEQELWDTQRTIHEARKNERWYRNTQACLRPGKCPFFELCTTGYVHESGSLPPQGYIIIEDKHPELTTTPQEVSP